MTREEFIRRLKDVIEWQGDFDTNTRLRGSDRWDSVAVMSAAMMINTELGLIVPAEALQAAATVDNVVGLAGVD